MAPDPLLDNIRDDPSSNRDFHTDVYEDEEREEVYGLFGHDLLEFTGVFAFSDDVDVFAAFEQASWRSSGIMCTRKIREGTHRLAA